MDGFINLGLIFKAYEFYKFNGYSEINVPMLVSKQSSGLTKPPKAKDLHHNEDLVYVASAEQSFIELFKQNQISEGRYFGTTPCYRDEHVLDSEHLLVFLKTELIHINSSDVQRVLSDAKSCFSMLGLVTHTEQTDIGYDIIHTPTGIELGSYGCRNMFDGTPYVYGTGIAEPRASACLKVQI